MPWSPKSFAAHNKGADTPKKREIGAKVANDVLKRTGDEGRAIRAGNAAVANIGRKKKK